MSALAEDVMHPRIEVRVRPPKPPASDQPEADTPAQRFWHWFAIVALLLCWIAEATLCAERGF